MKGLLFTFALTYGGAAASLFRPFIGLCVYVCFAILRPEALWHWSVPAGNYSRIVAIALLAGWALHGFGDWQFGRARPIVFAALAFWASAIASAAMSPDQAAGWTYVENLSNILLPFIVGATVIRTPGEVRALLWVVTLSLGYLACEMNLAYRAGHDFVSNGFMRFDNNVAALTVTPGVGLGILLAISEKRRTLRLAAIVTALAAAHVAMFSYSRGAMLAVAVAGVAVFFLIPKTGRNCLAFAAVAAVCFWLAGEGVVKEFDSTFTEGDVAGAEDKSRALMWRDCATSMLANPAFGIGPNRWREECVQFGWPRGKEAHSTWFQAGAELGIPGAASLLALYVMAIWEMLRLCKQGDAGTAWAAEYGRAIVAGLSGILVAISFITTHGVEAPYYLVMLAAATTKIYSLGPSSPEGPAQFASLPLAGRQFAEAATP